MREESTAQLQPGMAVRAGQQVVAGEEAIGELVGVLERDGEHYLHVRRFGTGHDELYIPSVAVERSLADHIYLSLNALDLVGRAWHEPPTDL